jgi:hypothetical protein
MSFAPPLRQPGQILRKVKCPAPPILSTNKSIKNTATDCDAVRQACLSLLLLPKSSFLPFGLDRRRGATELECADAFLSSPLLGAPNIMPRVKTEDLKEGMVVAKDVKNIDDMLLLPAKCQLAGRQISILKAWGVAEIDVEASDLIENQDPLARLSPEVVAQLTAGVKARFWQADESNPVFAEIFKLMLWRQARKEPKV